jgi:hypothetical protein
MVEMRTSLIIVGLGLLLAGCQTAQSVEKYSGFDNTGFMTLWNTYRSCESGTDLEAMRSAARHLQKQAYQPAVTKTDFHLPRAIERWVSEPPARLAVDPKAMAAACTLHTGHTALEVGRPDVADEMFRIVLKNPADTLSYYAEQARAGLSQLSSTSQASLQFPLPAPRFVSLSAAPMGK